MKDVISQDMIPDNMFFTVVGYTFDFNGLDNQNRNYVLEGNKEIMVAPSSVSLLGLGTLKVQNTTGTMQETSVFDVNGDMNIDKIQKDTTTDTTNYILSGGLITIGDEFTWGGYTDNEDLQGRLTLSPTAEEDGMMREAH